MPAPSQDHDVLRTITRRRPLLETLEDGPCRKRTLVDRLDCSRSTVDRAVREVEQRRLVERTDEGYRLTPAGRLLLAEHRRGLAALESIGEASDLLRHVPREAPLSTAMLEGATTVEPPPHAPTEPLQRLEALLADADRVRAVSAAERFPALRRRLLERTVEGSLDAELVFTEELASFLVAEYPDQIRAVMTDGGADLYALESVPYELTLVEAAETRTVLLFVLNETMEIRGVLSNESAAAFAWAESVYDRFRSTADPLSLPA